MVLLRDEAGPIVSRPRSSQVAIPEFRTDQSQLGLTSRKSLMFLNVAGEVRLSVLGCRMGQ